MVGQFANQLDVFLTAARVRLQVRACATVQYDARAESHEATAMFIVGPVCNVKQRLESGGHSITRGDGEVPPEVDAQIEHVSKVVLQRAYSGAAGQDRSRGWPTIQGTKEKQPHQVLHHTKKIGIFFGSNASRRTRDGAQKRAANREERAEKWYERTGQQQHWRR